MISRTVNRDIDQGRNFAFGATALSANGSPWDITGWTAYCQIRQHPSSEYGVNLTTAITGSTGEIRISLGATSTAALTAGLYHYDVEIKNSNGDAYLIVQGMVTVYPRTTRV